MNVNSVAQDFTKMKINIWLKIMTKSCNVKNVKLVTLHQKYRNKGISKNGHRISTGLVLWQLRSEILSLVTLIQDGF